MKIILIAMLTLPLLIGVSCKKESENVDNFKRNLIGKWEWVETFQPGINWHVTPENTGINEEMNITNSNILISRTNGFNIDLNYQITHEGDRYYMIINSNENIKLIPFINNKAEVSLNKFADTLTISNEAVIGEVAYIYKKVNN